MGQGVEWEADGWDWDCPTRVSSTHFFPALGCCLWRTKRGHEPGGPWGSSSTPLRHPGPTGISCAGACGRLRPVCTPHSAARQRGAVRLGPWVSPPTQSARGPEDLSGLARGTPTASSPSAAIRGEQTPGDSTPGTHPREPLSPTWRSPGSRLLSRRPPAHLHRACAQTCRLPGDRLLRPLRSPPPPGAAGRTPACQASAGSRCRGGRGAATAHRALRAGRGGGRQPPHGGHHSSPSSWRHARAGGERLAGRRGPAAPSGGTEGGQACACTRRPENTGTA